MLTRTCPARRQVAQLVEEIDIFPSLLELAGLTIPADLQGQSWVPLLSDPSTPGKAAVFSQYPHSSGARQHLTMGYSMRTKDYRYTEWRRFNCSLMTPMDNCAPDASAVPQWDDAELWGTFTLYCSYHQELAAVKLVTV